MPKIEIELLSEIEGLKNQINLEKDLKEWYVKKLESLDEDVLVKKAIKLSYSLFNRYMENVFKGLGFDIDWHSQYPVVFVGDLRHYLDSGMTDLNGLTVEVEATVSQQFKHAFLKIGIDPAFKPKNKKLSLPEDL